MLGSRQVNYEPHIINQFASKLYSKAQMVIVQWFCIGGFVGIPVGIVGSQFLKSYLPPLVTVFLVSAIGGAIGAAIGTEKAFWYKLQAQLALCQMKIEENIRGGNLQSYPIDSTLSYPSKATIPLSNTISAPPYCPRCNVRLVEGVIFCPDCGHQLK